MFEINKCVKCGEQRATETKRTGETALCVQMKQLKPLNEALQL